MQISLTHLRNSLSKPQRASMRALLLTLLCSYSASVSAQQTTTPMQASDWLANLSTRQLEPDYQQLARDSTALRTAIDTHCTHPGNTTLDSARKAWRQTASVLREVSALPFGPLLESRSLRRMDFWPTRPAQITESIAANPADAMAMEAIGVTAQGMPALEYLLFDPAYKLDAAGCRYAIRVAEVISTEFAALPARWATWRAQLAGKSTEEEQALLAEGLNILVGATDTLRLKYLEKPARSKSRQPDFDAWRSQQSGAQLKSYFHGLRGGLGGLGELLRSRGEGQLAGKLDSAVRRSQQSIDKLPAQLHTAPGRKAALNAATEIGRLQRLLVEDTATKLNVAIGFGDGDGD